MLLYTTNERCSFNQHISVYLINLSLNRISFYIISLFSYGFIHLHISFCALFIECNLHYMFLYYVIPKTSIGLSHHFSWSKHSPQFYNIFYNIIPRNLSGRRLESHPPRDCTSRPPPAACAGCPPPYTTHTTAGPAPAPSSTARYHDNPGLPSLPPYLPPSSRRLVGIGAGRGCGGDRSVGAG